MFFIDDIVSIIGNVAGIIIKPAKIITKKIVDEVEEVVKDIIE